MPLRYIRKRLTAENALSVAVATSELSREISDLLQFAPARAATGILLLIFKTIQDIQKNRTECYRLGRRCLSILTDVRDAMDGRWHNAPESLLKNISKFEHVLQAIHDDLKREAEGKWSDRLLRKRSIETALSEYHAQIDDSARSFQLATLIHLHHAVGDADSNRKRKLDPLPIASSQDTQSTSSPAPPYSPGPIRRTSSTSSTPSPVLCQSPSAMSTFSLSDSLHSITEIATHSSTHSFEIVEEPTTTREDISGDGYEAQSEALEEAAFLAEIASFEHRGFKTYHTSDISIHTAKRSRISSGWWKGAREVEVDGRKALMLSYERQDGVKKVTAAKRWLKDVRTLQNVYHPNLPQMIGYSGTDAPTPFILLANVQTLLPQSRLLSALNDASLLECTKLLITFCKDTLDAAMYLSRQISLSESKTQDYVEHGSFRISVAPSGEQVVIMGLPPPEDNVDKIESYRNFGLAWSVRDVWLKVLPNRGIAYKLVDRYDDLPPERQMKLNHLTFLAKALLPSDDTPKVAGEYLHTVVREISSADDMIDEGEDEEAELARWKMNTAKAPRAPLSLSKLRLLAIRHSKHAQSWSNNFVPAFLFRVGDIGYVPSFSAEHLDSDDGLAAYGGFHRFVRLCNILDEEDDGTLDTEEEALGTTTSLDSGRFDRTQLTGFEVGGGIFGWPIITSPQKQVSVQITHEERLTNINHAWELLLSLAPQLAAKHQVRPEDLMLVTRAGTDHRFKITDIRSAPPRFHHNHSSHVHARPGLGSPHQYPTSFAQYHQVNTAHHFHHSAFPEPPPQPTYLFTSSEKDAEARLSDSPVYTPPPNARRKKKEQPQPARCIWAGDGVYGFMNYVRLHEEDFL